MEIVHGGIQNQLLGKLELLRTPCMPTQRGEIFPAVPADVYQQSDFIEASERTLELRGLDRYVTIAPTTEEAVRRIDANTELQLAIVAPESLRKPDYQSSLAHWVEYHSFPHRFERIPIVDSTGAPSVELATMFSTDMRADISETIRTTLCNNALEELRFGGLRSDGSLEENAKSETIVLFRGTNPHHDSDDPGIAIVESIYSREARGTNVGVTPELRAELAELIDGLSIQEMLLQGDGFEDGEVVRSSRLWRPTDIKLGFAYLQTLRMIRGIIENNHRGVIEIPPGCKGVYRQHETPHWSPRERGPRMFRATDIPR